MDQDSANEDYSDAGSNVANNDRAENARHRRTIRSITVKTPTFCRANPALWFIQMEAHFEMNRITSDRTKYNAIVASIDGNILQNVSDVVINPPQNNRYVTIKTRVLERFADSDESRLRKLLTGLSLGDKKPSQLLREMRELAGTGLSVAVLKSLWLQRLPAQCQAILSISSEEIDKVAAMADKICEISVSEICSVKADSKNHNNDNSLASKIDVLIKRIDKIESEIAKASRFNSNSRSRSQSVKRSASRSNENVERLCWYHKVFADKATKCMTPCS